MDIGKISAKELCARYPTTNHRRRWRPMKRGNRVMLEHFDFNQDIDWTKRAPGHYLQPNRPGALSSSVLCWEVWKLGVLRKNCGLGVVSSSCRLQLLEPAQTKCFDPHWYLQEDCGNYYWGPFFSSRRGVMTDRCVAGLSFEWPLEISKLLLNLFKYCSKTFT